MGKLLVGLIGCIVIGGVGLLLLVALLPAQLSRVGVDSATSCLTPGTPGASCASSSIDGNGVAAAALAIAEHLSGNPSVWYDAGLPHAVLDFWAHACPTGSDCWSNWQEGNLQCVMLVTGSYALAGSPLPAAGHAIDFWSLYQHRPGWVEIPSAVAPPSQRGMPQPGDIMVWSDPPPRVGHVAIVLAVQPPAGSHNGAITFAEANGPAPIVSETLLPDLTVLTWTTPIPYTVLGYIRPVQTPH